MGFQTNLHASESVGLYSFLAASYLSFFGSLVIVFVFVGGVIFTINEEFFDYNLVLFLCVWLSIIFLSAVYIIVGVGVFLFFCNNYGSYSNWERQVCSTGSSFEVYIYGIYTIDVNPENGPLCSMRWFYLYSLILSVVCFGGMCTAFLLFI